MTAPSDTTPPDPTPPDPTPLDPTPFDGILTDLGERHRDEVLAAFAAVEHSDGPVPEVLLLGLRDVTLRRHVEQLLHAVGRTLVRAGAQQWTSGYRDDVRTELTRQGWQPLGELDRAVLALILLHSVAVPRSEGSLGGDTWVGGRPTRPEELLEHAQVGRGDVRQALRRLRAAGLVQIARGRDQAGAGYLPGPQFHRLTPAARRRLQENLILAAGPETPVAAAVRARRAEEAAGRAAAEAAGRAGTAGEFGEIATTTEPGDG